MINRYTILMLIALFVLAGCTQPTLANTEQPPIMEPASTPLSTLAKTIDSPTQTPLMITDIPLSAPPKITAVPTITESPPTTTPLPTMIPIPDSVQLNGLSPETFIYFPEEVAQHSQQILAHGQTLGRNHQRFSKIGDSIVDTEQFFVPFDAGNYTLGEYQYLEQAVQHYAGSYSRFGFALRDGLNSTSVMDPMWADKAQCQANETPLACEIRLQNPSLMLIHFGTNDWTGTFEVNMRQIIEYVINEGIVPVLITKANRVDTNNERNEILRTLAAEYRIPLWDFDMIAETLPERGLAQDDAHLSISTEFDYSQTGPIYQGYKAFNLSGLMLLDTFIRDAFAISEANTSIGLIAVHLDNIL
jgi:hypothetical protein